MIGTVEEVIRAKLERAFSPSYLVIEDESAMHAGHAGAAPGGQTHFRVRIVAEAFRGQAKIARQRQVYALLKEEFAAGLHALALQTLTPEEADVSN